MKVEVGQLWQFGEKEFFVISSIDCEECSIVFDDGGVLEKENVRDPSINSIARLVSTHPTFYEAIAEMGRLVKGSEVNNERE